MNLGKTIHNIIRANPILHNRSVIRGAGYVWNRLKVAVVPRGLEVAGVKILDRPGPRLAYYKYLRGERLNPMDLAGLIVGKDVTIETPSGPQPYLDLDYTATKPILQPVLDLLVDMYRFRHNIHRGPSWKSRLSTAMFEEARGIVGRYFGYDPQRDIVAFTSNTTHAIYLVAQKIQLGPEDVVLIATDNHHSGQLPFRVRFTEKQYIFVPIRKSDWTTDLDALRALCREYGSRVKLFVDVHVSNVTGVINDVHEAARIVHGVGAKILIDAAQSAAVVPLEMHPPDQAAIDFVAIGGHKDYAGDGSGAIIGEKEFFRGEPPIPGGGTVVGVTKKVIHWADPPHNLEAGTQNIVGAIALAQALILLKEAGLREIREREQAIARYALEKLGSLPFVHIIGQPDFSKGERMGVISFYMKDAARADIHSDKVGTILGFEHAIGIRTGCFCAGPYMVELLDLTEDEADEIARDKAGGHIEKVPHACRASFSFATTHAEVDRLVAALRKIHLGQHDGYRLDDDHGTWEPVGFDPRFGDYIRFLYTPPS